MAFANPSVPKVSAGTARPINGNWQADTRGRVSLQPDKGALKEQAQMRLPHVFNSVGHKAW